MLSSCHEEIVHKPVLCRTTIMSVAFVIATDQGISNQVKVGDTVQELVSELKHVSELIFSNNTTTTAPRSSTFSFLVCALSWLIRIASRCVLKDYELDHLCNKNKLNISEFL